MSRESFENFVIVDEAALLKARAMICGCEACSYDADVRFSSVLDELLRRVPETTDYVLEAAMRCGHCGRPITEKTMVALRDRD